jgi:hypothetical protein
VSGAETTDAELIHRSLEDAEEFREVFERHYDAVRRFTQRIVGRETGEEIAAQTFLIAFERRATCDLGYPSARSWLFGIAYNVARHHLRSERSQQDLLARLPRVREATDPIEVETLESRPSMQLAWRRSSARRFRPYGRSSAVLSCWWRWGSSRIRRPQVDRYGRGGLQIVDVESLPADPQGLRRAIHAGRVIEEPAGPLGVFTGIGDLLAQPNTPPAVRRGLLELAAETPGVTLRSGITDPLGRPGEGFTFEVKPSTETLIIDPDTGRLLATVGVDERGRTSWSAYVRAATVSTDSATP